VGINLEYGGVVDEVTYKGINWADKGFGRGDPGRQIQVSLYDGNDPANGPNWTDPNWPWNPVQGGNRRGEPSILLESQQRGSNSFYTKTRPQQWNHTLGLSDVIVEQWVTISGNSVLFRYQVTHTGNDEHGYCPHEFPVFYLKPTFEAPVTLLDGVRTDQSRWLRGRWAGITNEEGEGIFIIPYTNYDYFFDVITRGGDPPDTNFIQVWAKCSFGPSGTPESVREMEVRMLFGRPEDVDRY
jgi:hypothetical protein